MNKQCWLALIVALSSSCVRADHTADVERLVKPVFDAKEMVGCVVGVTADGKHEVYSFGEVHLGKGDKPDGDTIYEIGSLTKAFTGTILGDMVNRGEIKLDAPLQDFMPDGVKLDVAQNQPIKIVDVASQSSGLPRMPDNMNPKDPRNPYADYTPELMFEFLGKHKLRRPPGEYEYSNLGMGLLGYVMAKHAGKSYEELATERICEPLKMNDTRITLSDEQKKRLAPPYDAGLGAQKNWDIPTFAGAGALRSTVNDLLKFADAALANDDQPIAKAVHEAWKVHYGKPGELCVGLGWHQARDGVTWWHNGQTAGYTSAMYVHPPKKLAVVVLSNTACEHTTPLAEKITQSGLGMKPEAIAIRKTVEVDPEVLKSYEGMYALSLVFALTITEEGGKLFAQATGQDKAQIFPKKENEFFYKVVNAQITFEKDEHGKINKLVLHQNGQDMPGIKVPMPEAKSAASKK
jgi:serine-type D-Ala-D-Ala carboxypeptidase/endopeptidase